MCEISVFGWLCCTSAAILNSDIVIWKKKNFFLNAQQNCEKNDVSIVPIAQLQQKLWLKHWHLHVYFHQNGAMDFGEMYRKSPSQNLIFFLTKSGITSLVVEISSWSIHQILSWKKLYQMTLKLKRLFPYLSFRWYT